MSPIIDFTLETGPSFNLLLYGILGAVLCWLIQDYGRMLRARGHLPPGPFPLPIIGNHFDWPNKQCWIKLSQWSETAYPSDKQMITMWLGRTPYIICNSAWAAADLMDHRANIYSSRPHMIGMGDVILASNSNQTALPCDKWRVHRKIMHNVVGSQAIGQSKGIQLEEAKVLTQDFLSKPEDHILAIERYSCSIVAILGWGRRIATAEDYLLKQALAFMEGANLIIPGAYWFETIPALVKLPSWIYPTAAPITKGMRGVKRYFRDLANEGAQSQEPCFSKVLVQDQKKLGLSDDEVSDLTALLVGGGVDTTSCSLLSFLLAMCTHPEVQAKAQAELDAVVGHDRSPEPEDNEQLPYIAALVKEAFRWSTVATLGGIPHSPTQDDVYGDYLIPKGSWIVGNVYAMHRNKRDFVDPEAFRPERYLNGNEKPYPNEFGHNAFGFGRRACSGRPLAVQGLVLTLTRLLWAFKMLPGLDEQGNPIKLATDHQTAYNESENTRPKPFKIRFVPRSDKIKALIMGEAESALEYLSIYSGESKVRIRS